MRHPPREIWTEIFDIMLLVVIYLTVIMTSSLLVLFDIMLLLLGLVGNCFTSFRRSSFLTL